MITNLYGQSFAEETATQPTSSDIVIVKISEVAGSQHTAFLFYFP